ncbi:hypothetical protein ACFSQ7_25425 [Paenibacillus rhizoplanae]
MRRTREKIRESLRFQKMMTGVAPLERAETVLDRIHFTQEIESARCVFVRGGECNRELGDQAGGIRTA